MIGLLRGTVWSTEADKVVLDVNGVGYMLHVPANISRLNIGEERVFFTHLIVREDDMSLYGFVNREDKELFAQLLAVSGIGPKAALAMLSSLSVQQIKQAIVQDNSAVLTAVPGIGNKIAKRLVLELKDKMKDADIIESFNPAPAVSREMDAALDTLLVLGFSRAEAREALAKVDKNELTTEAQIKAALSFLAKKP